MDCVTAAELLPWLLNGSLEAAERDRVVAHLDGCEGCRRELSECVEMWQIIDAHPSAASLFDLATTGEASAEGGVGEHLEGCADCRSDLALLENLDLEDGVVEEFPNRASRVRRWQALALAATVLMGFSLGGLVWTVAREPAQPGTDLEARQQRIALLEAENRRLIDELQGAERARAQQKSVSDELRERIQALSLPRLNLPVIELFPLQLSVRGSGDERSSIAGTANAATLILAAPPGPTPPPLRLEIRDEAGTVVWQSEDVVRQETDDFSLHLPAGTLSSGEHRILILSQQDGNWQEVATYLLEVRAAP